MAWKSNRIKKERIMMTLRIVFIDLMGQMTQTGVMKILAMAM